VHLQLDAGEWGDPRCERASDLNAGVLSRPLSSSALLTLRSSSPLLQAFICFLISCNIGEIFCIFFASILGMPEPLTAIHLLWVNLVTDGPPATALGFNPPDPDVMLSSPRRGDEEIMTGWLLMRYMLTGLYVGLATVGVTVWHYMSEAGVSWTSLRRWGSCEEVSERGKTSGGRELTAGNGRRGIGGEGQPAQRKLLRATGPERAAQNALLKTRCTEKAPRNKLAARN